MIDTPAYGHRGGGVGQRIFGSEKIRRIRVIHDGGEPVCRDVDTGDVFWVGLHIGQDAGKAIQRGMNRIAAGIETKIVAHDVPGATEFVSQPVRLEPIAYELTERQLNSVLLSLKSGKRQLGSKCSGEATHATSDIQSSGSRYGIRIAGCQNQGCRDPHGAADSGSIKSEQARAGRSS